MATRRGRSLSVSSSSPARAPPRVQHSGRYHRQPNSYNQNREPRQHRSRGSYPYPHNDKRGSSNSKVTLVLCVYGGPSQGYRTTSVTFDKYRTTDEELWQDIRDTYRSELDTLWRRVLLFKTVKFLSPIEFSKNDVPKRQDPKDVPGVHEFVHAYHHPTWIRTTHSWVDWFVDFEKDPQRTYGLEFVEGLWADKIALEAGIFTIAIIVGSAVWCAYGGSLQDVFTTMSFVLTLIAAEIALITLYYQVSLPG